MKRLSRRRRPRHDPTSIVLSSAPPPPPTSSIAFNHHSHTPWPLPTDLVSKVRTSPRTRLITACGDFSTHSSEHLSVSIHHVLACMRLIALKMSRVMSDDAAVPSSLSFKCAVTDSKGPRRFMEDAHSIVVPFGGVRGQGFFAIFDGHAGKQAAEWCGQNFALVRPCLHATLRTRLQHSPSAY